MRELPQKLRLSKLMPSRFSGKLDARQRRIVGQFGRGIKKTSFQPLSFERSIQKAADNQEKAFGLLGVTLFHGIHN
jgi:hypothetical protein